MKNAVVQVAEQVRQNEITFEDAGAEQDAEQNATYSIPYPVSAWYGVVTDEALPLEERDDAAKQLETFADSGNQYAQYLLGKLCLSGDGAPQDKDAAYDWFQKAQAQGHDYAGFFMDRIERPEPPNVLLSATRLLYHMGKIFQSSAPAPQSCGVQIDRKRLAKLRRIRMAAGHKADDHEQEQSSSTMSMGW